MRAFVVLALLPLLCPAQDLRLSVYATAGGIHRYLADSAGRDKAVLVLRDLRINRIFLEGRRGDEYVPPQKLAELRDFFQARGFQVSGGIATVPGQSFGARQVGPLGWLNWESDKTRKGIAGFFTENAPVFDELIVDDFYCTADASPESERARGNRRWGDYRRDLLVSLIDPLMVAPARAARPETRLIIKYPQWYDRFHLFGYDPQRMSRFFHQVWVGTEVRNPLTRRMGFVQPTEGYMNFRWISAAVGGKVTGAWFDHIECTAQNFVDQAWQSVLAGARELTLFHLGDLMEGHPGHAPFKQQIQGMSDLAARVRTRAPRGIACYKPPSSESEENLYLMDYAGMLGLPVVPVAHYPHAEKVAMLGVQAAADPQLIENLRRHLVEGATLILTPALVRALEEEAAPLSGTRTSPEPRPGTVTALRIGDRELKLEAPLDVDTGFSAPPPLVLIRSGALPILTERKSSNGRVLVWNVRTFNEADYRASGEWLLAPRPLGLASIPQALADELRTRFLEPLGVRFQAPAGVGFYLFSDFAVFYNFLDRPVETTYNGKPVRIQANGIEYR